jgi:hypothetical protein
MALRLLTASKNTRRNKGNSNAVMVAQIRKRNNWKLGGTHKAIHE